MKALLTLSLCLAASACSPSGELSRTLHAPHPKYLDRLGPDPAPPLPTAEAAVPETKLNPGLPMECKTANSNPLCLSCDEGGLIVYRCYDFKGVWKAEDACHHDGDSIKCLVKDPPFALFLDYKGSEEKFFRENLKTWMDSVHQIWDEKFTAAEKLDSEHIFRSFAVLSDILTAQTARSAADNQRFFEALDLPKEQQSLGLAFLGKIEKDRLSGRLKITDVMKDYGELIEETHGLSLLFEKFEAMSLEGLEN